MRRGPTGRGRLEGQGARDRPGGGTSDLRLSAQKRPADPSRRAKPELAASGSIVCRLGQPTYVRYHWTTSSLKRDHPTTRRVALFGRRLNPSHGPSSADPSRADHRTGHRRSAGVSGRSDMPNFMPSLTEPAPHKQSIGRPPPTSRIFAPVSSGNCPVCRKCLSKQVLPHANDCRIR